jgi:DNA ligase-associated metallophosphoesterase
MADYSIHSNQWSSTKGAVPIQLQGYRLYLMPQRALFWEAERTLVVSDLHLGKGALFRSRGIPIPRGATREDLSRLSHLAAQTASERLVILGDLFHGRDGLTQGILHHMDDWRRRHQRLEVTVVAGNHDRLCIDAIHRIGLSTADSLDVGPFRFQHQARGESRRFSVSGHLHPGVRLRLGRAGGRRTYPCFLVGSRRAVLPAFGSFTGLGDFRIRRDDRLFVTDGEQVVSMPPGIVG